MLKIQFQAKLDDARSIERSGNHSKRWTPERGIRCAKPRTVEDVEELTAKLELRTLREVEELDHGQIRVLDAISPAGYRSRSVTEGEIGILLESGRVEPLRDLLGPRPSRTILVACICDPVRPAGAAERAGCLAGLRDRQGISAGKRRYACNFPP